MVKDPQRRLVDVEAIKASPFFKGADWARLARKGYPAPISVRKFTSYEVFACWDARSHLEAHEGTAVRSQPLAAEAEALFAGL
eukprot:NODE_1389_length_979_cov_84.360215_g1072_i0.p2 GENE.NODE_1389_length_979_cov_84.360215_g1072_i0~~NODE_1389_length_979_cov_84.360215_g1072_i0.p2  ORF type:complete len:83 (+),score=12.78 NODE_1389_length_979_cov_84.360215_g1072_i0:578-826(+)